MPLATSEFKERTHDQFAKLAVLVAQAAETFAPAIRVGGQDGVGPGRVLVESPSWQEEVNLLARGSAFIWVVPHYSAGILWELGNLRDSGLLWKCLFVMPPDPGNSPWWTNTWSHTERTLKLGGIGLPPYSKGGMVFRLNDDWNVAASESLPTMDADGFRIAANRLLSRLPTNL